MALDAKIVDVVTYTGGATLVLEDRVPGSNEAGQARMEILNPTVIPRVGDELWGGAGFALIVSGGIEFPYKRVGYTKLVQDWQAKSVLDEANRVSETPEAARQYLIEKGYDVDALVARGMEKIKEIQSRLA